MHHPPLPRPLNQPRQALGAGEILLNCIDRDGRADGFDTIIIIIHAPPQTHRNQALGAGEILLNCIDRDGRADGFDCELVALVSAAVSIPVIASSGAGSPAHFSQARRWGSGGGEGNQGLRLKSSVLATVLAAFKWFG